MRTAASGRPRAARIAQRRATPLSQKREYLIRA